MQQWHHCSVSRALLGPYQREDDYFLGRIVAMDETWARSYEPNLKRQSNDGRSDGVRRLPNIWQKVINKGADYNEGT